MRWRSDTVMTFQTTPAPARTPAAPTHHGTVVRAGASSIPGLTSMAAARAPVRPRAASTRSAASDPSTAPTAPAVISTPNPASDSPIGPGSTA